MFLLREIFFKTVTPSPEVISETLKKNTGVNVALNDRNDEFLFPSEIPNRGFNFIVIENAIHLYCGWDEHCYAMDATIYSLIMLGGKYEFEHLIPDVGKLKWEDAKNYYLEYASQPGTCGSGTFPQ